MSNKSYLSLIGIIGAVSLVWVVGSLFVTNPQAVGPLGVTLWFIGFFIALQCVLAIVLYIAKSSREQPLVPSKRLLAAWRQGLLVAMGITIFLALSSLRQLAIRDVILISAVLALVEFYFRTRA